MHPMGTWPALSRFCEGGRKKSCFSALRREGVHKVDHSRVISEPFVTKMSQIHSRNDPIKSISKLSENVKAISRMQWGEPPPLPPPATPPPPPHPYPLSSRRISLAKLHELLSHKDKFGFTPVQHTHTLLSSCTHACARMRTHTRKHTRMHTRTHAGE